jgi:hypothetical protein
VGNYGGAGLGNYGGVHKGGETDFRCAEREVDGYRCAHNHGAYDGSRQAVTKKMTLAHKKAA